MKFLSPILIVFAITFSSYAQVGVGTTTPRAALEINSSIPGGLLIPTYALRGNIDTNTVINPNGGALVAGTLIFNTATIIGNNPITPGYVYWNGTIWVQMTPAASVDKWNLRGNTVVDADFLGTINDKPIKFRVKNIERVQFTNSGQIVPINLTESILIGENSRVGLNNVEQGVSIGKNAITNQYRSVAVGSEAEAIGDRSVALGEGARATTNNAVALGSRAEAISANTASAVAIGVLSKARGSSSIAIGDTSESFGANSVAIGNRAQSNFNDPNKTNGIAIGLRSKAEGASSTAVGQVAQAIGDNSVAIGDISQATNSNTIAVGRDAQATGSNSTAVGQASRAIQTNSSAFGNGAVTTLANQVVLGNTSIAEVKTAGKLNIGRTDNNTNYIMPNTRGANNQVLQTDGSGNVTWKTPTAGGSVAPKYGEIFLKDDVDFQFSQYNDNLALPASFAAGNGSANVDLLLNGIRYTGSPSSAPFKVTYTITYKVMNGMIPYAPDIKSVEFYLSKNNSGRIPSTSIYTEITDDKIHTVTVVKILQLDAEQTYFIQAGKTDSATPNAQTPKIKIFANMTNLTIESL
ncbi:autotransporter adhesin [Aequorivita sublithincola DSM 14238]|uniref:Autotransporter adhesin n=1 Tax=Aequorivita sublithincola (strain DSM 14238 / LMG 21431 / ACAM 643 / 9-3) TaxID=746697 RepID=I3YZS6_AEQSU|nr:autotransporter adhesin [Aequorivita sublithincola]AFL82494.1 autotransporter adhesin [Aequorivita sublithincola DSM 14238]